MYKKYWMKSLLFFGIVVVLYYFRGIVDEKKLKFIMMFFSLVSFYYYMLGVLWNSVKTERNKLLGFFSKKIIKKMKSKEILLTTLKEMTSEKLDEDDFDDKLNYILMDMDLAFVIDILKTQMKNSEFDIPEKKVSYKLLKSLAEYRYQPALEFLKEYKNEFNIAGVRT